MSERTVAIISFRDVSEFILRWDSSEGEPLSTWFRGTAAEAAVAATQIESIEWGDPPAPKPRARRKTETTWRTLLDEARGSELLIACTLSHQDWDEPFEPGLGSGKGSDFTAWTETRVFFPVVYDGAQWVGCVPRNPCDEPTKPQGGGSY